MFSHKRDGRITYLQNVSSGGVAAVLSKTLTAPLDVIKIRTQVGAGDTKHGLLRAFTALYRREGPRAFWKGNLVGCLRLMPYTAIQLGIFHKLKLLLADSCGRLNPLTAMMAGSGAGVMATVILYPSDTIKTRLIMQHLRPRWRHYHGIWDAVRVITRDEGFLALYRGVTTSIIGMLPYSGATFLAYDCLDQVYVVFNIPVTPLNAFINGCLASTFASTVSFPFDTIRKKMQAFSPVLRNKGGTDVPNALTVRGTYSHIVKLHGFFSLWRGMMANLLKVGPYTGLMFCIYESCRNGWLHHNGYTLSRTQENPHPFVDQSMLPDEVEEMWEELDPEHLHQLGLTTMEDEEGGSQVLGHKEALCY